MRTIAILFFAFVTTAMSEPPVTEPDDNRDERRKIAEFNAAQKSAQEATARLVAIEAGLSALAAADGKSTHLAALKAVVKEQRAEATKCQLAVSDLKKRYRIIDLAQLPAEARKKVILNYQ